MPPTGSPPNSSPELPHFVVGKAYSRRKEITGRFGGSWQSGIAPSDQSPAIFLFTGTSGEKYGYRDGFTNDGYFRYSGEGQVGPMTLSGGNLAITAHTSKGKALHLFEYTGKGKPYIYLGEFVYGSHVVERGPDRKGDLRDVIIFCLVPVDFPMRFEREEDLEDGPSLENSDSAPQDLTTLRAKALSACTVPAGSIAPKEAIRAIYHRSVQVKRYVLARAAGHCELCNAPAPFKKKDGRPYLEPHHINRVSDGGPDHPLHVGAICPTCHRNIHFGLDGNEENERLRKIVAAREA